MEDEPLPVGGHRRHERCRRGRIRQVLVEQGTGVADTRNVLEVGVADILGDRQSFREVRDRLIEHLVTRERIPRYEL